MTLTFNFEKSYSPILGIIHRPVAQVFFLSRSQNKLYETWMIVDTGADYTLLPKYFAQRLDVNLNKDCKVFKTAGIGGKEKVFLLERIKVKIGNWERIIPIGFLNRDDIPPLMGRHLFFETFEVVFSKKYKVTFSI